MLETRVLVKPPVPYSALVSLRSHLAITIVLAIAVGCGSSSVTTKKNRTASPKAGGIDGVVLDKVTGAPISFVTVIAKAYKTNQTYSHTTDGSGRFVLDALPAGTYQVVASYGRHSTRQTGVPVTARKRTHMHVHLDMRVAQAVTAPYKPVAAVPAPPKKAITSKTRGAIEGLVRNAKTKELLPGAVVGASSSVLPEPRLAVADKQGRYRLLGLPPGTYVLSIYYTVVERGNVEFRRSGVEVSGGKATVIDLMLDTEKH